MAKPSKVEKTEAPVKATGSVITIADLAEELGMDPAICRRVLRSKAEKKEGTRWEWTSKKDPSYLEVKEILKQPIAPRGRKPKEDEVVAAPVSKKKGKVVEVEEQEEVKPKKGKKSAEVVEMPAPAKKVKKSGSAFDEEEPVAKKSRKG